MVGNVLGTLASIQLTVLLLLVFAVAIAAATFLEGDVGTEGARALVYNARWFEGLLSLLTLNLLLTLGRWFPYQPRRTGFFLVHVAMIVILLSAGMTRFLGQEGTMHIREGEQSDTMLSREDHVQITTGEATASFPVRPYRPGPMSMTRRVTVEDRDYRVAVKEYWPHYEQEHAHEHRESDALELSVGREGRSSLSLSPGHQDRVGDVLLAYGESTLLSSVGHPAFGSLDVRVGDESGSVPVTPDVPIELQLGGVTCTVTEFQTDFTVEGHGERPVRMSNPMVRVNLRTADGDQDQRMLFAYHPDFAAQHGRPEGKLAKVEVHYRFERRLVFAGSAGSVQACASFGLVQLGADGGQTGHQMISPGRPFDVMAATVYRTRENDFSFVLRGVGVEVARASDAPPAIRVEVEGPDGESGAAILTHGTGTWPVELGDRTIGAAFGPIRIDLPYALQLDEFVLLTYPGGDRPAGYESHLKLLDPEQGIDGRPVTIRMNSPLAHQGRKHFQNSYDTDKRGTILIVNHDPGKWPTYFGYTLITLGFLLSLLKDVIWPRPRATAERVGRIV